MSHPQTSESRHIAALDGLRGLAIIGVLIAHSSLGWRLTPSIIPLEQVWLQLVGAGRFGVDLFFVLSAFLITGILLDAKRDGGGLRNFYGRRALRILPMYYLVLLLVLPLQAPGAIAGWEPWYWLNLSNWAQAQGAGAASATGYNVFWSLSVEEQFYAVWPLLVMALPSKRLAQIAAAGVIVALVTRTGLLVAGVSADAIYFATPSHFDSLGAGAWLAIAARQSAGLAIYRRSARVIGGAVGVALIIAAVMTAGFAGTSWAVVSVVSSLFPVFFAACLLLAVAGEPGGLVRRIGELKALRTLGKYSYCLYLIHVPVGATVRLIAYGGLWEQLAPLGPVAHLVIWVGVVAGSLGIAWLSWRYVEAPLLWLKRFLSYEPANAPALLQPLTHQAI